MSALEKVMEEADPERRVVALGEFIDRGDTTMVKARTARLDTIRELRKAGATWPHIKALTGLSEQWMRRELAK